MKAIILVLLMCPVVFAAEDPFTVSTKVTEYPARDGRKLGKILREQTFRGKTKIRDRSQVDTDRDGVMDDFFDSFWIDGEAVYSTRRSKTENSSSFSSHGDVDVQLTESKTTGQVQQIAFLTSKGVFREMFVRNAKGEFEPLSKEEFTKAVQHSKELSPFMEGILDTIRDAKPKETPNKSVEPTPTR